MDYPQQHIKPYNEEGKKTEQVERMFDNIAHAYDKLNHTLSLGIDRSWRRKAIAWLRPFHPQRMMDVATGTGDFAILACRKLQPAELIGTDISEGMMNVGREKVKKEGLSDKISFAREDCTSLSFADNDFDAHAYDKLNHTLSLGIDRSWRRKAIAWLRPFHPQRMMDVATGTGDFAILACRKLQPAELIGTDISEGMMNVGREKVKKEGLSDKISFAREDCTSLSFADNDFDAITVAFGIRNFEDLDKGLSEMCRVLKPGGHLVILELTTPDRFPMKQLFSIYSKAVIPLLGKLLSKDNSAYRYLPDTIKVFPQGEIMKGVISRAGFSEVNFRRLTFGICTLYTATK